MTRIPLLLVLFSTLALAQAEYVPTPSEGGCSVDVEIASYAPSYRATTLTAGSVGFGCDGALENCLAGPGLRQSIGFNEDGEILIGPGSGATTVARLYGTLHLIELRPQYIVASNFLQALYFLQSAGGHADNQNAEPFLFNDTQGTRFMCKATLTTCGSAAALEGTELKICGAGGAKTKKCECTYDGTTYAWLNSYNPSAGVGTATSCPATP